MLAEQTHLGQLLASKHVYDTRQVSWVYESDPLGLICPPAQVSHASHAELGSTECTATSQVSKIVYMSVCWCVRLLVTVRVFPFFFSSYIFFESKLAFIYTHNLFFLCSWWVEQTTQGPLTFRNCVSATDCQLSSVSRLLPVGHNVCNGFLLEWAGRQNVLGSLLLNTSADIGFFFCSKLYFHFFSKSRKFLSTLVDKVR